MPRKHPEQVNFRCSESEKEAYLELVGAVETPLAEIIRTQLNRLVRKHLGYDLVAQREED